MQQDDHDLESKVQELLTNPKISIVDVNYAQHKHPAVYALHHVKTGKIYGGRTGCFNIRMRRHRLDLQKGKHENHLLQSAFDLDPEIEVSFIPMSDWDQIVSLEQKLIDFLFSSDRALNIEKCATGFSEKMPVSEEIREKLRLATKKSWESEEKKQAMSVRLKKLWKDPTYRTDVLSKRKAARANRSESEKAVSRERFRQAILRKYEDPEFKAKVLRSIESRRRALSVGGMHFTHLKRASEVTGLCMNTIKKRIRSDAYPDYFYVDP